MSHELAAMSPEYINEKARQAQLNLLRANLAQRTYHDYPSSANRLVAWLPELDQTADGRLEIPDGPWTINEHPNRSDVETSPSKLEQQQLTQAGFQLDASGRPLHPWLTPMIEDPTIGVVNGKGAYWQWGPNYTADAAIMHNGLIRLIKRQDTGLWALPGGFVDSGEEPLAAAIREAYEETGIVIPEHCRGVLAYQGPVVDLRVTANAWPETSLYAFRLSADEVETATNEAEVADAIWVPPLEALHREILFGSHRFLLQRAIGQLAIEAAY
jgi:ADP-ribose pyrophosphatase